MNSQPRTPWLTLAFVAANLILASMVTVGGGALVEQFGFKANSPSLVNAFVSMFLHWNVFHLLANMLFLAVAGTAVEQAAGMGRYAVVYLVGGLVGSGVHWAVFKSVGDPAPLIGASACVASCIGYAGVRYGRTKVALSRGLNVPILALAVVWVVFQALGVFVRLGDATGGVGFAAHLGGLAFGLLMSVVFKATESSDIELAHSHLARSQQQGPDAVLAAALAILADRPGDRVAQMQAADAAQALGNADVEIRWRHQLISSDPDRSIIRLSELGALEALTPLERMKLAQGRAPQVQAILMKSVVAMPDEPERPNALLELIQLEPNGPWAETLRREYPMHAVADIARAKGLIR